MKRAIIGLSALVALTSLCGAASLDLNYIESPLGGDLFQYDLTLGVDQTSTAWAPGMGWSWITFGDMANSTSPLHDFLLTSTPPAPFTAVSLSQGGHTGPTWLFGGSTVTYWTPGAATDTLSWEGTSSYDASTRGSLYFSESLPTGGGAADSFKLMVPASTPEPATLALALGSVGIYLRRRRAARA